MNPSVPQAKPVYGWDAPGIMVGFIGAGVALVSGGLLLAYLQPVALSHAIGRVLSLIGVVPLLLGLAMLQYGLGGKLRTREAMLDFVAWRGDERVLDVGPGAGLLLVGVAKRLTRGGRVTGIDVWAAKDLSNNAAAATLYNLAIEGVADRAEVLTQDATRMGFADNSFDVVLSLLCLHNIEPKADKAVACHEIARVLKPSGRVVIGDYVPTHDYAGALAASGLVVRQSTAAFGVAGALMWLLVADKPAVQP
jgi:arsenite methyltransferase